MLTKFESKSARVKGLAFHPVRPWVCASLHNGVIQLWDYRVGTVIDRFEEHDGPVRGVDFHLSEPLLVSGGDDYKIKVWDYKLRRCLFTLLGHLDYIRTVQFHPQASQFPWILSASDDQTLRLWDFTRRTCLSVLTGHNHYVMCASFHPTDDLIVSASLDQTVRVWDTTGLRKKQMGGEMDGGAGMNGGGPGGMGQSMQAQRSSATVQGLNVQAELFGTNDVVVKYVLEGHDRGVNWACFHPSLPLLASAADDRQVKLWRMSETKAWEVDTLRGHANNVSCCLFHPKHDLIVSNSEDRSIRVWDVSKRVGVQTFRREGDRFWILAAHRNQNLLAAGHDSGMIVFKLERERPAACYGPSPGLLYYVRGRELFLHDSTRSTGGAGTVGGVDVPITSLRRMGQQAQTDGIGSSPRFLSYNHHNPAEGNILVTSDVDGGSYELITFSLTNASGTVTDGKRGSCLGPGVFLGRNRFAVLDRQRQIVIKSLNNETTKRVQPPVPNVDGLYDGGASGRILLRAEDRAILLEVQSRRVLGEITAPKMKSVVWSPDGKKVAILCKFGLVICNRQLEQLCSISDNVRIKSGAWDVSPTGGTASELFLYTTLHHVKYCLPSGDTGTIRTLDQPLYAMRVVRDELFCLDRESRPRILSVDTTEARFKLALAQQKYGKVMHMVRHSRLCGRAIVAYLQSKGFPEVALHFVREPQTRFRLALACGNIEAAMESAFTLEQQQQQASAYNDPAGGGGGGAKDLTGSSRRVWGELGSEALRQGNHQVVEMSYQRTKDFDRLSFLYVITGDTDKLRKMLKIANMRQDIMGRYHNALLLGDATERVHVLEESGNLPLAYISAKMHGLDEDAERIKIAIETAEGTVEGLMEKVTPKDGDARAAARLLQPPTPIFRACSNWPTLEIPKTTLEDLSAAAAAAGSTEDDEDEAAAAAQQEVAWEDAMADEDEAAAAATSAAALAVDNDDMGFGDDDDLGDWGDDLDELGELGDSNRGAAAAPKETNLDQVDDDDVGAFAMPNAGKPPAALWVANSSHAADHMAAGAASSALQLLNRQIAASEFSVLKDTMMKCYLGSMMSVPGIPGTTTAASLSVPLLRNDLSGHPGNESLPRIPLKLMDLSAGVKAGYKCFQGGKFNDARLAFLQVLMQIPLVVTENRAEATTMKEMLVVCREYITAIRVKGAISDAASDPVRSTELSAYFTHCNLQPVHLLLALRAAMGTAFKHKNFIAAAGFARRLLELPDMSSERNAELRTKATKVLQKSEQMARNEHTLNYDETKAFAIDCKELKPIYGHDKSVSCSFCGSSYADEGMTQKACYTCTYCAVGIKTIGLVTG